MNTRNDLEVHHHHVLEHNFSHEDRVGDLQLRCFVFQYHNYFPIAGIFAFLHPSLPNFLNYKWVA